MSISELIRLVWRSVTLFFLTGVIALCGRVHRKIVGGSRGTRIWNKYYYGPWGRLLLRVFKVRLICKCDEQPDSRRVKLLVSNHSSPLDIAILTALFQGRFVAQAEIIDWPIIGFATATARAVFVDRGDPKSGARAIVGIRKALGEERDTVALFPESVASQGDEVLEFHKGGFLAAKGLDVDLVPIGIAYPPGTEWDEESFVQHLTRVAVRPSLTVAVRVGAGYKMKNAPSEEAKKARQKVQLLTFQAREALNEDQAAR